MHHLLYDYRQLHPTTWVYLSSLMTIAIYFKFGRFWSVRNLDLLGLIALSPGFLLVAGHVEWRDQQEPRRQRVQAVSALSQQTCKYDQSSYVSC